MRGRGGCVGGVGSRREGWNSQSYRTQAVDGRQPPLVEREYAVCGRRAVAALAPFLALAVALALALRSRKARERQDETRRAAGGCLSQQRSVGGRVREHALRHFSRASSQAGRQVMLLASCWQAGGGPKRRLLSPLSLDPRALSPLCSILLRHPFSAPGPTGARRAGMRQPAGRWGTGRAGQGRAGKRAPGLARDGWLASGRPSLARGRAQGERAMRSAPPGAVRESQRTDDSLAANRSRGAWVDAAGLLDGRCVLGLSCHYYIWTMLAGAHVRCGRERADPGRR